MKKVLILLVFVCLSCSVKSSKVTSPDENIEINFHLSEEGRFFYTIAYKNKAIIDTSFVGFTLLDAPDLEKGFIANVKEPIIHKETWQMPWGEQLDIVNNYNGVLGC